MWLENICTYFISFGFSRNHLKKLLQDLNLQKRILKKNGITVDGKHWQVEFKGKYD
jgi:hypothetical protein